MAPAAPSRANEPLTAVQRVHAFFRRFFLVGLSQVVLRPWRTDRPVDGRCTTNVTRAEAMVAGLLIAAEQREAEEWGAKWPEAWDALSKRKVRKWLG